MDNFIVVYGPPRTGTSLLCQLVEYCGYSFGYGVDLGKKELLIRSSGVGTHHHKSSSTADGHVAFEVKNFDGNAFKVIGFNEVIPKLFGEELNIKIIGTNRRDDYARQESTHALDIQAGFEILGGVFQKVFRYGASQLSNQRPDIYKERKDFLEKYKGNYEYMDIFFEDILRKDKKVLQKLCNFIEVKLTPDLHSDLNKIIKPEVSAFWNEDYGN